MPQEWSLFTNHGLVLMAVARHPTMRLRDIAATVGITERSAHGIVNDLVEAGYVERSREGRRNRYLVRGDRELRLPSPGSHELSSLLRAVVAAPRLEPGRSDCAALVLACSDHRYQEPLRALVATEGLLDRAEIVLWPGGGSALAGPDGERILASLEQLYRTRAPGRVLLTAHQGCTVPGAFVRRRRDPFSARRAIVERRRRIASRVARRLGIDPELWFLDSRGASRVRIASSSGPEIQPLEVLAK